MIREKDFIDLCVGTVTVITSDSLVLTGQIKWNRWEEFITITLTEPLLIIPGAAGPAPVQPFYVVGDTVRINEDLIVTVGPSHISLV
jgi:hypothetical protein